MVFSTTTTAYNSLLNLSPSSSSSSFSSKYQFRFPKHNNRHSLKAISFSSSSSQKSQSQTYPLLTPSLTSSSSSCSVTVKLNHLASEFSSLTEPIERVKRLLHYASMLPPLNDSDRVPENRVSGCSTQVWLVSFLDEEGKMRFRADSDSEISKGFCWCLVWVLDGAEPNEVLRVHREDLGHVDVLGLGLKAQSRVNTWHNVLFGMQKATRDFVLRMELEMEMELELEGKGFPSSLIVTPRGGDDNKETWEIFPG